MSLFKIACNKEYKMKKSGLFFTAAVGGLMFAATCSPQAEKPKAEAVKGECHGINSCKGQGACGGKDHSCAGQNACKGQGWLKMTEEECNAQKGTFKPLSMSM